MADQSDKNLFRDFADAGRPVTILVFILPVLIALGFIWFCESREPNCQDRKEAAEEAKAKENKPDSLSMLFKGYRTTPEQKPVERNAPSKCSVPCHIVNKALDDPVALFTAFLVYVVYFQVLFMLRQETWLRRSFKAAAGSATAAMHALGLSKTTSMSELRAYVGLETIHHTNTRGIQIKFRNFGRTPADHVSIVYTCVEKPLADTYRHPETTDRDPFGNQLLQPTQSFDMTAFAAIDGVCVDRVMDIALSRGDPFYIYGRIDYADIYDRFWISYFCQRYEPGMPEGRRCTPHHHHNYEVEAKAPK